MDCGKRARSARYAALANWAGEAGIDAIALGHTCDDQAETFLLRLSRGSGLVGLAGMPRRYSDYSLQFADFNWWISIGGFGFGLSQLILLWILIDVCFRKKGEAVSDQVWDGADGLEWTPPSPAPYHSFSTPPVVK